MGMSKVITKPTGLADVWSQDSGWGTGTDDQKQNDILLKNEGPD